MDNKEIERYLKAAAEGSIPDSENPLFLFSVTESKLLIRMANGEISAEQLARRELANRGIGLNGEWIGFDAAQKLWSLPRPGLRRPRKGPKL